MPLSPHVDEFARVGVLARDIQDPRERARLGLGVPWGLVPVRLRIREVW